MGSEASEIQKEIEGEDRESKLGIDRERVRIIKRQSQTEKQTIREKDRWKLREPDSEK